MDVHALFSYLSSKYPAKIFSIIEKHAAGIELDVVPELIVQLVHRGCGISNVFASECGRSGVDPAQVYGLQLEDAELMRAHNKVGGYFTEFPDFGALDVLLPPGFVDVSWHNDAAPSFARELPDGQYLTVWIDYADVSKRESKGAKRFTAMLFSCRDSFEANAVFTSDDWSTMLNWISTANLVASVMYEGLFNPVSGADVEPDDVYAYLDETESGSVEGFKAWLHA